MRIIYTTASALPIQRYIFKEIIFVKAFDVQMYEDIAL